MEFVLSIISFIHKISSFSLSYKLFIYCEILSYSQLTCLSLTITSLSNCRQVANIISRKQISLKRSVYHRVPWRSAKTPLRMNNYVAVLAESAVTSTGSLGIIPKNLSVINVKCSLNI